LLLLSLTVTTLARKPLENKKNNKSQLKQQDSVCFGWQEFAGGQLPLLNIAAYG